MSDEERIVELTAALADVISRKVSQIKDVTSSTRTLALNALIEATRAGEAGRGFAVVAGEVKQVSENINAITQSLESELNKAVGELSHLARNMLSAKQQ